MLNEMSGFGGMGYACHERGTGVRAMLPSCGHFVKLHITPAKVLKLQT